MPRAVEPEQHAHQGGFARAVISQKRVDLSLPELKGDIVIGNNAREFLCDVEHLDDVLSFHISHPASSVEYDNII